MLLFFDTETTGFMKPNKPANHPEQAHIVQLAAQLVTPKNETVMEFSLIVDPGVHIPSGAANIHGIDDEKAAKYGVTPSTAVDFFDLFYSHAETVVAHNIAFDKQVMETAIARRTGKISPLSKHMHCTMKQAHDIVKAPPTERMIAAGRTHHKAPNLGECIKHFFDEKLEGAHDAMIDVVACRRVYFAMNPPTA